jgi:hypothetical protein
MSGRLSASLAGTVALLGGLALPAPALDTPNERITLVGLTGVHVVVYRIGIEGDQGELARPSLLAELEQRLRLAGLRPLSPTEAVRSAGRPTLELRLHLARSRQAPRLYVYSVQLALRQQIQLARARTLESFAITWSEPSDVGTVDPAHLSVVLDAMRAKVDQFLAAWRAANPD